MVIDRLKTEMGERVALFRKLVDRFGAGILDAVSQHTIEQARARLETADLERRDLDAVMELLWDQMPEDTEFTVEERSPELLKIRVTKCLFAGEMRRLGAADIGSAFYCSYDHGFCLGLNPAIRFTRTKTLMRGDDSCNHTYALSKDRARGA